MVSEDIINEIVSEVLKNLDDPNRVTFTKPQAIKKIAESRKDSLK